MDRDTFQQNSTEPFAIFFDDEVDNKTGITGVAGSVVSYLSEAGGAFAVVAPTIAEIGSGWYQITPIASHRDTLGPAVWRFTAPGANSVEKSHRIIDGTVSVDQVEGTDATDYFDAMITAIQGTQQSAAAAALTAFGASTFDAGSDLVDVGSVEGTDATDYFAAVITAIQGTQQSAALAAMVDYLETQTRAKGGLAVLSLFNLLAAGVLGKSSAPDVNTEKFLHLDDSDAFTTTFDGDDYRTGVVVH